MAKDLPFFGYKKLTFLLRSRFGIIINKKKGYRLCKEMALLLPIIRHHSSSNTEIVFKKVSVDPKYTLSDGYYVCDCFPQNNLYPGDTYTLEIVGYKAGFSITKNDVIKTVIKAIA